MFIDIDYGKTYTKNVYISNICIKCTYTKGIGIKNILISNAYTRNIYFSNVCRRTSICFNNICIGFSTIIDTKNVFFKG